ncbi:hypothetical protein QBC34DRAFT_386601 [Podospora aff. communis PSN243]|uniref:Uncharacterized protein n=1 Tax=Podospora aff. communis PSN243 TaxID=3040156 RepID=A0AAV9G4Q0_9PEZI|nr:hypothetical protein QBC34DRAFT_386601 [Podospora aff. communis PSN243]
MRLLHAKSFELKTFIEADTPRYAILSHIAELSEAINSMFNWYLEAEVYYAYLEDVSIEVLAPLVSPLIHLCG